MADYTYDETAIGDSSTDYISFVRFQLDDTNVSNSGAYADLSDDTITALYDETPTGDTQASRNYQTAIKAAEYLYRKYSKQPSFSADGVSMQYNERAKSWLNIVNTLRATWVQLTGSSQVIYARRSASFVE